MPARISATSPARRLATLALPGSGDFYVFDDPLVLFLHYAGNGTYSSFVTTEDPRRRNLPARLSRPSGSGHALS